MRNFRIPNGTCYFVNLVNRSGHQQLLLFGIFFLVCGRCLAEHCHQNELQQCMEHVKPIMQNVTIGFAANAEQLDTVCRLFREGMDCIDKFVLRCFQESQRLLFKENMAGVEEVMNKLCTDGEYRKEYLRHADCFRSVAPQYEECGGVFRTSVGNINQNRAAETQDKLSQMCGALHRFLECAYGLTSQHCGENGKSASEFLRTYTEKAVGSLITSTCKKFPAVEHKSAATSNRIVELDEADGLREVNVQEDFTTTVLFTTIKPNRSSRRGSKKADGRRSKSTTPGSTSSVRPGQTAKSQSQKSQLQNDQTPQRPGNNASWRISSHKSLLLICCCMMIVVSLVFLMGF